MSKVLFIDTETTGLNPKECGIIQIAGLIEIDGEVKDAFDLKLNPLPDCKFEPGAVEKHGIEPPDLFNHKDTFKDFKDILNEYVNPYDKNDKFTIAGYNVKFDVNFLSALWKKNNDNYFGAYFSPYMLDIYPLIQYFKYIGIPAFDGIQNLKLETVYPHIMKEEFKAHDAFDDIKSTYTLAQELKKYVKV